MFSRYLYLFVFFKRFSNVINRCTIDFTVNVPECGGLVIFRSCVEFVQLY